MHLTCTIVGVLKAPHVGALTPFLIVEPQDYLRRQQAQLWEKEHEFSVRVTQPPLQKDLV